MPEKGKRKLAVDLGRAVAEMRNGMNYLLQEKITQHAPHINFQERQPERSYLQRESHYFLGRRYLLRVIQEEKPAYIVIKNKTYLELHVRPGTSKESRASYMEEWYREELKALIPPLLAKWEKKIGVKVEDWAIRKMKTKWGSCNIAQKKILFNLELAKKLLPCLEYIVVHELVHLLERLHNERFQAHMDRFLPKWKTYRDELNNLPVSYSIVNTVHRQIASAGLSSFIESQAFPQWHSICTHASSIYTMKRTHFCTGSGGKVAMLAIAILGLAGGRLCGQAPGVKNILLIYGTFADGSGWQSVFSILTAKGYNVTVVQNP